MFCVEGERYTDRGRVAPYSNMRLIAVKFYMMVFDAMLMSLRYGVTKGGEYRKQRYGRTLGLTSEKSSCVSEALHLYLHTESYAWHGIGCGSFRHAKALE